MNAVNAVNAVTQWRTAPGAAASRTAPHALPIDRSPTP